MKMTQHVSVNQDFCCIVKKKRTSRRRFFIGASLLNGRLSGGNGLGVLVHDAVRDDQAVLQLSGSFGEVAVVLPQISGVHTGALGGDVGSDDEVAGISLLIHDFFSFMMNRFERSLNLF